MQNPGGRFIPRNRRGRGNYGRGGNNRGGGGHQQGNRQDNYRGNNYHRNEDQGNAEGIDQNNPSRNGPRNGRVRHMGFKYVSELLNNDDLEKVIFELSNDRKGFGELLESKTFSDDMIILLVKLMRKVCDHTFPSSKIAVLSIFYKSSFINCLKLFITNIVTQLAKDKVRNKLFWDDPDEFWTNITYILRHSLDIMPSMCCEISKQILSTLKIYFPHIEQAHSIHISDEIKITIESLLEGVEKTLKELERKREQKETVNDLEELEPPDDFRQLSIIPSATEVTVPYPSFLRPNVVKGPYQSVHHYLDVQFRLLREDFVNPLRKGISSYIGKSKDRPENIRIYKPIRFLSIETVNEQNCYKIQFDFSKKKRTFNYENARKFMFGSLVCFTMNNFQTLLFGKIVQRDVKLLEKGQLIVGFHEDVAIQYEVDYLMVESSVYFEPYFQVLNVLKTMQVDDFPLEAYIIRVQTDTKPPDYLVQIDPVFYNIQGTSFLPLNWPDKKFYGLNEAQQMAFQAALTQEFSIIQGPPGTGKTFLGLKIAHTLLRNKDAWYKKTPMLVICYTNHALDQFLEGLLTVTNKVLRVGSQSKNENLNKYNIRNKRPKMDGAIFQKRREVRECMQAIQSISDILNEIESNRSVVSFSVFKEVIKGYDTTWFSQVGQADHKKWLLEGREMDHQRGLERQPTERAIEELLNLNLDDGEEPNNGDDGQAVIEEREEMIDDIFENLLVRAYRPLIHLQQLEDKMKILDQELHNLGNTQMPELQKMLQDEKIRNELWETWDEYNYVKMRLNEGMRRNRRRPEFVDLKKPQNMTAEDRWRLYFDWLGKYRRLFIEKRAEESLRFKRIYSVYNEMRDMEDTQTMKDQLVVGMTTTGAARLQSSLQSLKSPIVIVEEAAEVLEAHIVAALTSHCKHLILIGDHQQLKPSTADYNIETKMQLGISLFERMVINNIQCHTLNVQHRMRPEIARLICPAIYPKLENHETTLERPPISGVEKSVFFIDHQEQEQPCNDASKKNLHEATFLISLARHLILNGYQPEQITILAAYLGQMFAMQREKKKPSNHHLLQDVRISVLDNYQGEECDIILLSLVRSNDEQKIGFLKIENRVCVALSRARNGFYVMGNMKQLSGNSSIWPKIKSSLEDQEAIGPYLTLRCQVHRHKITTVKCADDFEKIIEGGCDELCESVIGCGHTCKRLCHVQDRDHNNLPCLEQCDKTLCNNPQHLCKKKCYESCGPCFYPVKRDLICGHTVTIECQIDPTQYKCTVLLRTKLPCDHEADKPCSADALTYNCPEPCDTRVEPCGHACSRRCHIRSDPDHLQYSCREPCARQRISCTQLDNPKHLCPKWCYQPCEECDIGVKKRRTVCPHVYVVACKANVDELECVKPCVKVLPCGHKCRSKCNEPCGQCNQMVKKTVPGCHHEVTVKCSEEPDRKLCKKKCPRPLPCGHKCTKRCDEPCTENCQEMVDCDILTPCGHYIKRIKCCLRDARDPSVLLEECTEKCNATLKCPHKCSGTCGECSQGRVHKRCTEKCGVPLICNHECPIPCREACKPCEKPCEYRCEHSKCRKKCGEPCTMCKEPCLRKCKHQACNKRCGDICSVPPCQKACEKKLSCEHNCVGFCGDPCPKLCRICNEDELTEIFFGTEDEEDAIFVLLEDCKHVLESTGMEGWLAQDADQIKAKVCPKCKTAIVRTTRYSDYVKRSMMDVLDVKRKTYGTTEENEKQRIELLAELEEIDIPYSQIGAISSPIHTLKKRLKQKRKDRIQAINGIELNAIKSKLQLIKCIIETFRGLSPYLILPDIDHCTRQVKFIVKALMRDDDRITNQEIEDIQLELGRLTRMVQFCKIQATDSYKYAKSKDEIVVLVQKIKDILYAHQKVSKAVDDIIQADLRELNAKVSATVTITDSEVREVVNAVQGVQRGAWFRCPNGHLYAIGECGGAMQVSKCVCGAQIGGTNHRLLEGQTFSNVDGARAPAWPGVQY